MKLRVLFIVCLLSLLFVSPVYAKDFSVIGNNMQVSSLRPSVNVVGVRYNLGLEYIKPQNGIINSKNKLVSNVVFTGNKISNNVTKSTSIVADNYNNINFPNCL